MSRSWSERWASNSVWDCVFLAFIKDIIASLRGIGE